MRFSVLPMAAGSGVGMALAGVACSISPDSLGQRLLEVQHNPVCTSDQKAQLLHGPLSVQVWVHFWTGSSSRMCFGIHQLAAAQNLR